MKSMSVLLVEDDLLAQMTLTNILKDVGFTNVEAVSSFQEAIEMSEQKKYDVAFCDIYLQGAPTGFELIKRLKESTDIKIVLQTGLPKQSVQGPEYNMVDYFVFKPYNYDDIASILLDLTKSADPPSDQ